MKSARSLSVIIGGTQDADHNNHHHHHHLHRQQQATTAGEEEEEQQMETNQLQHQQQLALTQFNRNNTADQSSAANAPTRNLTTMHLNAPPSLAPTGATCDEMQQQQQQQQQQCITGSCKHKLHSQYSMPCSLNSRRGADTTYQIHHSLFDEKIIYSQLSIAAKKDFSEEVRALLDVKKFVSESIIMLDVNEVRIGAIVEFVVDTLVECRHLDELVAEEAKSLLFVERNSFNMVLANTMQGLYKSRADGRLAYDHSWLVACCSLASLAKRQVAIARFAQPVNFGRQSCEVRFLIIVLAPNREKMTKSSWETGRTFATMFADIDFRRRLLRAKSQDEFKAELLIKAEALAREPDLFNQIDYQFSCKYEKHLKSRQGAAAGGGGKELASIINAADHRSLRGLSRAIGSGGGGKSGTDTKSDLAPAGAAGCCLSLGAGLCDDFKRRVNYYTSDFLDGMSTRRDIYKTISTTVFLYFSVLLPCIAFGVVDTNNTEGQIDPKKTMIGQAIGGLLFALFSGQPLVVIMTTAPLCIYVKVIYQISQDLEVEFGTFYACVGLWMSLFLILMSLSNSSNLMRYCTQSTENIFALFTAFAFGSDGIKEAIRSFNKYYWDPECNPTLAGGPVTEPTGANSIVAPQPPPPLPQAAALQAVATAGRHHPLVLLSRSVAGPAIEMLINGSAPLAATSLDYHPTLDAHPTQSLNHHLQQHPPIVSSGHHQNYQNPATLGAAPPIMSEAQFYAANARCQRETCILFLFLMSGTLFLANSFNSFNRTPYLSSRKREIIKDYALAISVLIFSFIGSYLFADIKLDVFEFSEFTGLHFVQLTNPSIAQQVLSGRVLLATSLLGFMLSVLFYIDQNVCGAMVNNAPYKLKKGDYFHLDLLVIAILNAMLSLTGLPWMHGKLPHSHLHSKALADYEERIDDGHVQQMIVNIRETRLSQLLCSLLIGLSLFAIPYPLAYIPLPVLSGVFLYTALAEFKSNSLVERVCLLFTEQAAYPPNHYIRRCPQRAIHYFTLAQCIQLALVSFVGFYPNPYVNMSFPLVVATFVPIRELLLPKLIDAKYLNSLDSASME